MTKVRYFSSINQSINQINFQVPIQYFLEGIIFKDYSPFIHSSHDPSENFDFELEIRKMKRMRYILYLLISYYDDIRAYGVLCVRRYLPRVVPAECIEYLIPVFLRSRWTAAISCETDAVGVPLFL